MVIVDVDGSSVPADSHATCQVSWLGVRVGSHLALSLHSSNKSSEFLQCPHRDDSTVNIVLVL